MNTMTRAQVRSAERTLSAGTWSIVFGAMLFSVLTVTPLVQDHTPKPWGWTSPILAIVVDAAVVIVVRLDSVVVRLGGDPGPWSVALRWMTGLMTLILNVANSALDHDPVGVGVHSVAPLLLIVASEAGLSYRRAINAALARIDQRETEERQAHERMRGEQEQRRRAEREQAEQRAAWAAREQRERDERAERERRDHEARMRQEQYAHDERMADAEAARAEAARLAELERDEARRAARRDERQSRERSPRPGLQRREHPRPEAPKPDGAAGREHPEAQPVNTDKLSESEALAIITDPANADKSVRDLVDLTGWSVGWISTRRNGTKTTEPPESIRLPEPIGGPDADFA